MNTALAVALAVVGLAGVACGVALAWFAWWFGEWERELAWPVQFGFLTFALLIGSGGVAAIRAGIATEDEAGPGGAP